MASEPHILVSVVYSAAARDLQEISLVLEPASTVAQALQLSGLLQRFPEPGQPSTVLVGVWGRKASLQQTLRQGDRVEIYRSLRVDPKVARRERFEKQGVRSAGLFATKRGRAQAKG